VLFSLEAFVQGKFDIIAHTQVFAIWIVRMT
jgi:hypothetical protein